MVKLVDTHEDLAAIELPPGIRRDVFTHCLEIAVAYDQLEDRKTAAMMVLFPGVINNNVKWIIEGMTDMEPRLSQEWGEFGANVLQHDVHQMDFARLFANDGGI